MNNQVVWIFKPIGWTPKQCVDKCKEYYPESKIAFAGRLDPMAYGLLPLIINDTKSKIQSAIQSTYKTYRFKLIVGLESDTYDILGIVKSRNNIAKNMDLNQIINMKTQKYPPYSSKTVFSDKYGKMVPLWKLAREGNLPNILPEREVDLEYIKLLDVKNVSGGKIHKRVNKRLQTIPDDSDFRKDVIINSWDMLPLNNNYTVYYLEARVSTGTYIRSIGNDLNGVVYDIYRTSVDDKTIDDNEDKRYDKFKFAMINDTIKND